MRIRSSTSTITDNQTKVGFPAIKLIRSLYRIHWTKVFGAWFRISRTGNIHPIGSSEFVWYGFISGSTNGSIEVDTEVAVDVSAVVAEVNEEELEDEEDTDTTTGDLLSISGNPREEKAQWAQRKASNVNTDGTKMVG